MLKTINLSTGLCDIRRRPVLSFRDIAISGVKKLICSQAILVSREVSRVSESCPHPATFRDTASARYILDLQQFIYSQVNGSDLEIVSQKILEGVQDALGIKKSEHENITNIKVFSNEVNLVVKFSEIICHGDLRRLDLETIPRVLRADLLINLAKFTGVRILYLGYGSIDSERMEKYYSIGIANMRMLTHFSLKRNCSDKIVEIMSKGCKYSLQVLDVEGSRDITDNCIQFLANFKLRELNIFNCSISVRGLGAVLQCLTGLLILHRGIELCQALEYQQLIDDATRRPSRKLKLISFQASEKIHFHTEQEIELVAAACPNIHKIIFKFSPQHFSSYLHLAMFEKLTHLETWGGEFHASALDQLVELVGGNLRTLHLCHVEEFSINSLLHIAKFCLSLEDLKLENCSYIQIQQSEEQEELFRMRMNHLLRLQVLTLVGETDLTITSAILSKALNIHTIEIDSESDIEDSTFSTILASNSLNKLKKLLIYSSRKLTLTTVYLLLSQCPEFCWVRYIDSWRSISPTEIGQFREYLRTNNIDLDTGEEERRQEMERRRERICGKERMKSTFCSTDILSKMFGPAFQEGEGYADGDRHLLENPFPQEGEGAPNHPF